MDRRYGYRSDVLLSDDSEPNVEAQFTVEDGRVAAVWIGRVDGKSVVTKDYADHIRDRLLANHAERMLDAWRAQR